MKTIAPFLRVTARPTIRSHALPSFGLRWAALLLHFVTQPAEAAVTEAWVQRYNSPANLNDTPSAVAVDASGAVAVTGTSFNGTDWDSYTAKYAAVGGALLWERPYNGLGNGNDYGKAVAVDSSGNVVVTGSSCYDSNGDIEYYTAKYAAADGALLWEKHYNNSSGYAAAIDLALDSRGNVVVTGTTFENGGWVHGQVCRGGRRTTLGTALHTPADRVAYARSVALDSSGNVVVTGYSRLSGRGRVVLLHSEIRGCRRCAALGKRGQCH